MLMRYLKALIFCMAAGSLVVQAIGAEPLVIEAQGSFSAGGTVRGNLRLQNH